MIFFISFILSVKIICVREITSCPMHCLTLPVCLAFLSCYTCHVSGPVYCAHYVRFCFHSAERGESLNTSLRVEVCEQCSKTEDALISDLTVGWFKMFIHYIGKLSCTVNISVMWIIGSVVYTSLNKTVWS